MPTKWYMTVGYPGGEFAWQADPESGERYTCGRGHIEQAADLVHTGHGYRAAPPDVAEWLSAPMHTYNPDRQRMKVPGGWLYAHRVDVARAFIPVAGTANITVLEARDAD